MILAQNHLQLSSGNNKIVIVLNDNYVNYIKTVSDFGIKFDTVLLYLKTNFFIQKEG